MNARAYGRAYRLAMGVSPTEEQVEVRHHEEAVLRWASEHKDFNDDVELVRLYAKHKKAQIRIDSQERLSAKYPSLVTVGIRDTFTEADQALRQKHGLQVGEQVWTSPINGESVKGVRGESFKRKAEELAVRTGYVKTREEMEW